MVERRRRKNLPRCSDDWNEWISDGVKNPDATRDDNDGTVTGREHAESKKAKRRLAGLSLRLPTAVTDVPRKSKSTKKTEFQVNETRLRADVTTDEQTKISERRAARTSAASSSSAVYPRPVAPMADRLCRPNYRYTVLRVTKRAEPARIGGKTVRERNYRLGTIIYSAIDIDVNKGKIFRQSRGRSMFTVVYLT